MKIIYNNILPFKGFIAMNLFGVLFARNEYKNQIDEEVINHESIHTAQMKELGYIAFYIIYFFEWIFWTIQYGDRMKGYRAISFEKEACNHQKKLDYLINRRHYSQWK